MADIQFRLTAYSDAAGKYNPQAFNNGNEDCFYVDDNLSDNQTNHCTPDQTVTLADCGMIMAVADGMGGMNAGEVASAIAVETVEDFFAPGKVTPAMAADARQREQYLEKLIVEADRRIKEDEQVNPDHDGMGSTIILAWLVGNELTVSWCGDSRAYRFNPATGIEMLSEDHSYVQDLVRKGVLTYRDTFGHPQGNIVTRSLGEPSGPAQPETRHFNVFQDDIIMLCSDGLSGVVYDRPETDASGRPLSPYNLQDIIAANTQSMTQCREKLFEAAQNSDWYDNVTVILCKITSGEPYVATAATAINNVASKTQSDAKPEPSDNLKDGFTHSVFVVKKQTVRYALAVVVAFLIGGAIMFFWLWRQQPETEPQQPQPAEVVSDNEPVTDAAADTEAEDETDVAEIQQDEVKTEPAKTDKKPARPHNTGRRTPNNKAANTETNTENVVPNQNADATNENANAEAPIEKPTDGLTPVAAPNESKEGQLNSTNPGNNNESLQLDEQATKNDSKE